jgi:hypothetical protein
MLFMVFEFKLCADWGAYVRSFNIYKLSHTNKT